MVRLALVTEVPGRLLVRQAHERVVVSTYVALAPANTLRPRSRLALKTGIARAQDALSQILDAMCCVAQLEGIPVCKLFSRDAEPCGYD